MKAGDCVALCYTVISTCLGPVYILQLKECETCKKILQHGVKEDRCSCMALDLDRLP